MSINNIQFGRYVEVKFVDIKTKDSYLIGNDFDIEFNYTKSVDEGSSSSTGTISIKGLTEATFLSLGERLKATVELTCGYTKSIDNSPVELFKAVIMNKTFEEKGSTTISTFEVSSNFVELQVGKKLSRNFPPETSFLSSLDEIIKDFKKKGFAFYPDRFWDSKSDVALVVDWISNLKYTQGFGVWGTPKQALTELLSPHGFEWRLKDDIVVLSVKPSEKTRILEMAKRAKDKTSLAKINSEYTVTEDDVLKKTPEKKPIGNSLAERYNKDKEIAVVFTDETGLLGTPIIKTLEVNKNYDEALTDSETLIERTPQQVKINKKGEVMKDKDGNVKLTKKKSYQKIGRLTVIAKAQINARVEPNSLVRIDTDVGITDGLYRARDIQFTGNNRDGAWVMEMELTT